MINNSSVNKSAVFENNWSDDAKNTLVSAGFNPDIFRPQEIFGAQKKEYTIIPDVTMTGDSVNQKFGYSVSTAGDVNGDGYADVIVGAPGYLSNTGRAYIYYGGPSMNNIADVILTGEAADNYFGHSVSTAGDVNGDGYADVIVGADYYNAHTGRAYIFYGGSSMDNVADVILTGEETNNHFGCSVSTAGDVNGDGYADVIVGAYQYYSGTGRAYIYYGSVSMDNIADVIMTGEALKGEALEGASVDIFGWSVSTAGDVNGDGYSDVIVGAYGYSLYTGRAYIYYGGSSMDNVADVILTGEGRGDDFGYSVSTAGDVNGDGYADVIVGAENYSSGNGRAYIYYGGAPMDNVANVIMTGEGRFGSSVSTAGDVNGDGYADVIVGADGFSSSTGRAYIYYGGTSMDNTADVIMTGEAVNNAFGNFVSSSGDVNGDGYADVIIGAQGYLSSTGRAYVYILNHAPSTWAYGTHSIYKIYGATGVSYTKNDTGRIFSLGGYWSGGSCINNTLIYNVITNTWTEKTPFPEARNNAASAILKDSIYIIGGYWGGVHNSVYKYDINADSWTTKTNYPISLFGCKGVGYQDSLIYVAGGFNGSAGINNVYLYNVNTNAWRTATSLPLARYYGAFSRIGDTLVYIGGYNGSVVATTYRGVISQTDRSQISWSTGANYPGGKRDQFNAAQWGDHGIIMVGGSDGILPKSDCYVYYPGANTWTKKPNKNKPAYGVLVGSVHTGDNKWKVVATSGNNGNIIDTTEIFTEVIPAYHNTWAYGTHSTYKIGSATAVSYTRNDTGWLFSIGGYWNGTAINNLIIYNINTNTWTEKTALPVPRYHAASALLKDSIYVIGGYYGGETNTFYKYGINENYWDQKANYPIWVQSCKAVGYQDSLIYVAGGLNNSGIVISSVYLYNVYTNSWRAASQLPGVRTVGAFSRTGDTLVYIGGYDGSVVTATTYKGVINQTDRSIISWTQGADYPGGVNMVFDAAPWGNLGIITVGGSSNTSGTILSSKCFVYSPGTNKWTSRADKNVAVCDHIVGSVYLGNNIWKFIAAEGFNGSDLLDTAEFLTDSILTSSTLSINLKALLSGNYNGITMVPKNVTVELHSATTPYVLVESKTVGLNSSGTGVPVFTVAVNGTPYYIALKFDNGLETWSATPQIFSGTVLNYDFTTASTQAYGSNMILVGNKWCIISGDVNQDRNVDALDRAFCWNERNLSGVYVTDLNGDGIVDAIDRSIAWNNRNLSVKSPVFVANSKEGVKKDNKVTKNNSKGTYDLKLDGSNAKKIIKTK
jgi:N-acetylneuraminic acid mutarotase